jgi:hypothetical protein
MPGENNVRELGLWPFKSRCDKVKITSGLLLVLFKLLISFSCPLVLFHQ